MAAPLAGATHQRARSEGGGVPVLSADDVPVPVSRRAARREPLRVHRRRYSWTISAPAGEHRVRADRLRRLRHPLGELRAEGRRAPDAAHPAEHRELPAPAASRGAHGRLEARAVHHGSELLQVDAVDLPAALQAGAGLQEEGGGQLVPERQDGAGERAGREWPLRALRRPGRAAAARAVVLPHHGLRGAAAAQSRVDRLVRVDQERAAQLARPLRGGGDLVRDRRI